MSALRTTCRVGTRSLALLVCLALVAGLLARNDRPADAFTSTITATGRAVYNRPDGTAVGLRNAFIKMCDDDGVAGCPTMGTSTTDSNGFFTVTGTGADPDVPLFPPDPPDPRIQVIATGPSARVETVLLADYCFASATINNTLPGPTYSFGTISPNTSTSCDIVHSSTSAHNGAWALYNDVRQEWELMRAETLRNPGRDIPQVRVIWPDTIANSTFYRPPLPTVDEGSISIKNGDEWSDATIMHEYGHHVLYHFAESPTPDYNNGVCDTIQFLEFGGHCVWHAEKGSVAWTEGWPDFLSEFMTTTLGKGETASSRWGQDPITGVTGSIESPPLPSPDPDLAHVEGTVAAILWDLLDSRADNRDFNNSTDRLNLSFSTLWDVYQNFDPDPFSSHDRIVNLDELWNAFAALRPTELNRVSEIYDENGLSKPAADLTVTAASTSPSTVAAGRTLTVFDTTGNAGAVRTGTGSVTRYYLQPASGLALLNPLGTRSVDDLLPGGSSSGSTTLAIPASTGPGTYVVRACADDDATTFETNETNNCRDSAPFSIVTAPSNDAFAAAAPLSGSSGTATGTNVGASREPSEPNHAAFAGGASVWWNWTAPASGQATFRTAGSSFDTLLGVYTGPAVDQLTVIGGNDDCCAGQTSEVTFAATAGTTYRIAVDGFAGATGSVSLGWDLVQPPPSVSIGDASVTEGDAGTVAMTFPVTLSSASSSTVSVNYATVAFSATAGTDFVPVSGTVSFAPGETSKDVTVPVKGDLLDEANETFVVTLSSPVGAVVGDGSAVGHIIDNDPLPSLRINSVQTTEGASGTKNLTFRVSLATPSGRSVQVHWATANGTALAGSDYVAGSGTLTIPAGATSATIVVKIKGDHVHEPNETFKVKLSAPVRATIAVANGTGTIVNDD